MARTYTRDARGRFAGGGGGSTGRGGGGGKGTAAARKTAMSREVTRTMLGGKATQGQRNPQRERYIGAQNTAAMALESSTRGKGSKAAKRAAGIAAAKKAAAKVGGPKTTSARGRAQANQRRAAAALKAGGGKKAAQSLLIADRARARYKATGTGTKRSPVKGKGSGKKAMAKVVTKKPLGWKIEDIGPGGKVARTTYGGAWAKGGRPKATSARGGKVGTRSEQRKAAKAQAARTQMFSSKVTSSSRSWIEPRKAYKALASRLRYERAIRREYGNGPRQVKAAQRALTTMRRTRQVPAAIVDRVRPVVRKRKG